MRRWGIFLFLAWCFTLSLPGRGLGDTLVIHPSGLASNSGWSITDDWVGGLDSDDGDTSRACTGGPLEEIFYVYMDDPELPDGSVINSITVSFVAESSGDPTVVRTGFSTDGGTTTTWGQSKALTRNWEIYATEAWTLNSAYGDIDLPDIYNLQVAIEKVSSEALGEACVTHVYATIDYTAGIPTLDWAGRSGFVSDGIHPDSAPKGSIFEFRVEYKDGDSETLLVKQVWIDSDDNGTYEPGEKFMMDEVDSGDPNYADGKEFILSTAITRAGDGVIKYRFFFNDGTHDARGDPTTDHTFVVTLGDNAPTLKETGRGGPLLTGTSPNWATSGSSFEFWAQYGDVDNDPPQVQQVWVDLDDSGSYEKEEKFDMVSLGGSDYGGGLDYMKSMTIYHPGEPSDGTLQYRFHFSDGLYLAEGDPTSDLAFTVEESGGIYYVSKDGENSGQYDAWARAATSVQAAVDHASKELGPNEVATVIVAEGTYGGAVTMRDGVHVINKAGDTPVLIGSQGDRQGAVTFSGTVNCNLRGFEITNIGSGAGVSMEGSSGMVRAVIEDCAIHHNSQGAGVRLNGQVGATITGCNIHSNDEGGIATRPGGMRPDQLQPGSSVAIRRNTIGGVEQGNGNAGIYLNGSGGNIQVTIGGPALSEGNAIFFNGEAGIKLQNIDMVSIENNDVSNNLEAGILLVDVNTVSPHVRNNHIHHHVNEAGINIGGASNVVIGDSNDIYANHGGIVFYVSGNSRLDGSASSQPVIIRRNNIYGNSFGGIAIRDAVTGKVSIAENSIYQNSHGGIGIHNSCELEIIANEISHNARGGIHTGTDAADGSGFPATNGSAEVTIRQNKVYGNGQSGEGGYGGGIDVRHASGSIENNLVYENKRGGIRFGDHIDSITNNTVVANGQDDIGGGIIYDDPVVGAVNDRADGVLRGSPVIRNNICAYNEKAGLRVGGNDYPCPEENPDYGDGGSYWDYNLLYANNDTGEDDCRWGSSNPQRRCVNRNYGGCWFACEEDVDGEQYCWSSTGPNGIVANPSFVEDGDDYHLAADSPALCAGICLDPPCSECLDTTRTDMGAYGGRYPIDW